MLPTRWQGAVCLSLLFLFLSTHTLHAQQQGQAPLAQELLSLAENLHIEPHAQLRLRTQIDANHELRTGTQPNLILPLWSVATLQIVGGDHIGGRVALGISGQLGTPQSIVPLLDEAYLETRIPWSGGLLRVRAGRQALHMLDPRLASEQSFLDPPERVDALRLSVGADTIELDAAVIKLRGEQQTRANGAELLALATLATYWGESIEAHLEMAGLLGSALSEIDDPQIEGDQRADLQVGQLGFGLVLTPIEALTARSALSWQTGRARGLDVSAYDLSWSLHLRVPVEPTPSIVIGMDYSSGEGARFDNHRTRFLSPLGERHNRFGAADRLAPENASDLFVRLSLEQDTSLLDLSLHRLSLAEAADTWVEVDGNNRSRGDKDTRLLGHEFDIEATLPLLAPIELELLYALFLPERAAGSRLGWQAAHRLLVGLRAAL